MSGASYNLNDPAFRGYTIDRDERVGVDVGAQAVERAVNVDRRHPEGHFHAKDETVGDVQPRLLWPNILTQRPIPSRAPAWAATVTASDKDPKPGAAGANPGFATFKGPGGTNPFSVFGAQSGQSPGGIGVAGAFAGLVQGRGAAGLVNGQPFGGSFGIFGAHPGAPSGATVSGGTIAGGQLTAGGASATQGGQVATGSGLAPGGGQPMHVRPIRDRGTVEDDRYEHLVAPDRPVWSSRFPKGWTGAMLCTSREEAQAEVFIPGAHGLVSANAPDADAALSTAIVDTDKADRVDPTRRASFGDFARVVKAPFGVVGANGVSWVLTNAHARNIAEAAGFATDVDATDGISTVARGAAVPVVHGVVSALRGGFLDVGPSTRRHSAGVDADGLRINMAGLSTRSLFRVPGSIAYDGPILFEPRPYEGGEGPDRMTVHIAWDDQIGGLNNGYRQPAGRRGGWRAFAEAVFETDNDTPPPPPPPPPPPEETWTPPPPPPPPPPDPEFWKKYNFPVDPWGQPVAPQFINRAAGAPKGGAPSSPPAPGPAPSPPPRVGPTTKSPLPRPIASTAMEVAVPALLFRPGSFSCGDFDLRNQAKRTEHHERHKREAPVIARIEGAWLKAGSSCNRGAPTYTHKPGYARYKSGTASGILAFFPPEVGMEDAATDFAPGGITRSTLTIATLKGVTQFGSGIPDPTTAALKSGWKFGARTSDDKFALVSTTSTGADDKTAVIPNLTGTIPVASSITANAIPKWSGTGGAQAPSAVSDDGTKVAISSKLTLPSNTTDNAVKLGTTGGLNSYSTGNTSYTENLYYDTAWKYVGNGGGTLLYQSNGTMTVYTAPVNAGGADAAATIVDRFSIGPTGVMKFANTQGTSNALSKFNASGMPVDSGVTDDGSLVSTSRTLQPSKGWAPALEAYETSGNVTLTEAGSAPIQHLKLDAARDCTLPDTPTTGLTYMIRNATTGGFDLTVKSSAGTTLATLAQGEWAWFQHSGSNTWLSWGLF